jgi:hypothetical protein
MSYYSYYLHKKYSVYFTPKYLFFLYLELICEVSKNSEPLYIDNLPYGLTI